MAPCPRSRYRGMVIDDTRRAGFHSWLKTLDGRVSVWVPRSVALKRWTRWPPRGAGAIRLGPAVGVAEIEKGFGEAVGFQPGKTPRLSGRSQESGTTNSIHDSGHGGTFWRRRRVSKVTVLLLIGVVSDPARLGAPAWDGGSAGRPGVVRPEGPDVALETAARIVAASVVLIARRQHHLGTGGGAPSRSGHRHLRQRRTAPGLPCRHARRVSPRAHRSRPMLAGEAQHDHAVAECELGVGDSVTLARHDQVLLEAERHGTASPWP